MIGFVGDALQVGYAEKYFAMPKCVGQGVVLLLFGCGKIR